MTDTVSTPLQTLRRDARGIALRTLAVTVLVVAASFLIPNQFTASTVVLPPNQNPNLADLMPSLGAIDLGRAMGLDTQKATDLYIGLLRSNSINRDLVHRFDLLRVYNVKDLEKASRTLTGHTSITLTNEGFVRVAVTEKSPKLAADLANTYVEELDEFLRTNTNSSARRTRLFLEQRLADTRRDLANAEDSLRDYQVQHKMPAFGADEDRSANAAGELVAQRVLREVELGTLESVSRGDNPRADELRNEIRQFNTQIERIPNTAMGVARLFRNMKTQEKILMILTEQYERARVMELKDVPTVEIVDRAVIPVHKSQPRRSYIAFAAFLVALGTNVALAWAREKSRRTA